MEQEQNKILDDDLEAKYRHEKDKQKVLAHLKEYSIAKLHDNPELIKAESKGEIPSSISLKITEKLVDMPKKSIDNRLDPSLYRDFDKSKGINPDSLFRRKNKNNPNRKKKTNLISSRNKSSIKPRNQKKIQEKKRLYEMNNNNNKKKT